MQPRRRRTAWSGQTGMVAWSGAILSLLSPAPAGILPIRRRGSDLVREVAFCLGNTDDPATAVFQAVVALQGKLGVERVALFAADGAGHWAELLAEAHGGKCAGEWAGRLDLKHLPTLAETLRSGLPSLHTDLSPLPAESARLLTGGLPALALCPLLAGRALVGFLALAASRHRTLARLLRRTDLQAALPMLALFIRTSGLQPDVLRPQEQIELLYEVTTHLNTDLSLEKVMANVLTQAIAKVGATRGSIFLLDENNRVSHRILARENLSPEVSALVIQEVMSHGLAAWILEHKEGALIEDVLQDERWVVLPDHAGQVRSVVAVPFLRLGRVEGMLFLTHPEVGRFRPEHLQLLTSIANQAAIAIQNARLYERVENERRTLSAILDSSAEAVVVTDPAGRLLLANRSARQSLGIENRVAPLSEVVLHPDLLAFLKRAASEEGTVSERVRLEDGRTLSVSVAPVRDREGRLIGHVAVMHDITHLVELDEMKSRFVSTVSHDLKSPLTAIRGYTELLRTVGPLNEEQALFSERILEVTREMAHLINNLLDLGKIEAGLGCEFQAVDLREVLLGAKYGLALPAQQKGLLIEVEVPATLPQVRGDPYRLQQVMANLVGNAIKYTPSGGRIWIRAEERPDEVLVSVSDTGIGISPADLPRVFEKFFRANDPRAGDEEGSGLGLAIVKSIVTEHGGRVWVESTLGKGSTFYFTLPKWAG